MIDLDLYADVLLSGRLAGLGSGSSAEQVEAALGRDYLDDVQRDKWMRRDYGLIEFYSNPSNDGWICFGFSIQIHRLSDGTELVPRSLVDRYGQFRSSVSLESMLEHFATIPSSPRLKPDKITADFGTFNVDGTSSYMTVIRQAGSDVVDLAREFGDIWSIEVRAPTP